MKADLERRLGALYKVGSGAGEFGFLASLQIGLVAANMFGVLTLFIGRVPDFQHLPRRRGRAAA